jgi:hypothetical protein
MLGRPSHGVARVLGDPWGGSDSLLGSSRRFLARVLGHPGRRRHRLLGRAGICGGPGRLEVEHRAGGPERRLCSR